MKTKKLFFRAIAILMAIAACQQADAQTLVLHLYDGTLVNIELNNKFRMANIGDMTYVTMPDGTTREYERTDIRTITYEGGGGRGDVNNDEVIDVADIACIIDLMAGKESSQGAYTQCPNTNHPHMIDLGLPSGTKWACCNVGALAPEGYGDFYAWGEIKPKDEFSWENYSHCDGTYDTCHDIGMNIAKTSNDVSTVNWGMQWHIPTFDQQQELITNTTALWTTQEGINGIKFTGKNGGSVFLPAGGHCWGAEAEGRGVHGYYWSSIPDMNYSYRSACLYISNDQPFKVVSYQSIASGLSVRPVAE